ncbi:hypothetical protein TCAL_12816 [Tigriopus californicus]|uniref:Nucleotide-diphospho-sugar transferase domain-containing protein n=1 Tax=Tigriopus californicus TaxID=6832 RepID=A0A553NZ79_TIGCA|nr:uncharacterized protein LOC131887422 [Tigriopus californicus]XP_059092013.1 uncharacterized protein LOC131887422 [Tigriopus californicus]TRY70741.1 hypothetical protein TCAL_12816 [Tigriopus californicus]|eukprot:TCALIF_12816-PA protein Name:"Similar to gnt1 Glucose N-acetyltransferase 1 (Neosartorya fumigata (strain ATCC MYA-4609 / Af293 / CBS 101355 / FGSC A1100))" AED:0.00 eAED:0.00 QI:53/1/1/1/1/1/3/4/420
MFWVCLLIYWLKGNPKYAAALEEMNSKKICQFGPWFKFLFLALAIIAVAVLMFVWSNLRFREPGTKSNRGQSQNPLDYRKPWILPFAHSSATKRVASPSDFINCVHQPLVQDRGAVFKPQSELSGKRFAYVWYASSPQYLCSALVALKILQNHRSKLGPLPYELDYVLMFVDSTLTDKAFANLTEKWEYEGGVLQNVTSLAKFAKGKSTFYKPTYQKFHAFQLIKYDRLILMDSDGFTMHQLDHLFQLEFPPGIQLAAPQGYWFRDKGVVIGSDPKCRGETVVAVTTVMMVVEPSLQLYYRVRRHFGSLKIDTGKPNFDMDIVNKEFSCGDEVLILPKHYGTIDSEYNEMEPLSSITEVCRNQANIQFLHFTSRGKPWTRTGGENRVMYKQEILKEIRPIFHEWALKVRHICPETIQVDM